MYEKQTLKSWFKNLFWGTWKETLFMKLLYHWRIQGGAWVPPPPYFQTKPKNVFFILRSPPPPPHLSQGLNDRPPPSPPTPQIWRSGSATVYYGTFSSIQWGFWPFIWIKAIMVYRQTVHYFKMLRLTFANRAAFCSFQNYLNVITNAVPVLC